VCMGVSGMSLAAVGTEGVWSFVGRLFLPAFAHNTVVGVGSLRHSCVPVWHSGLTQC
jgi:hypothetical protein